MDEQDPVAISSKAFQVFFGIALFISAIAFTPVSGWLGNASADWVASVGTYIKANPQSQSLDDALIGHWTFDGSDVVWTDTASEIKDRSGEGNHGDASGFNTGSVVAGVIGQGVFIAGSPESINVPSSSSVDDLLFSGNQQITISLWVNLESGVNTAQQKILDKLSTRGWDLEFRGNGEQIDFRVGASSQIGTWRVSSLNDEWAHYVVSYDASSETNDPAIYMNGVSQSVVEVQPYAGTIETDSGVDLSIGRSNGGGFHIEGGLDDLRIYNRALTPEEVESIYTEGLPNFFNTSQTASAEVEEEGLLSLFTFDGGNINWGDGGSEIKDASGQGNDVNATGGIDQGSTAIGQLGQGLAFDGVSDSLTIPHTPDLKPETITVSSWIKPTGIGPQRIVSNTEAGGVALGINLDFQDCTSTDNICFFVNVGGTYYSAETDLTNVPTGGWAQVTGTYDGETVRLYINGLLADSNTSPSGNITYTVNTPMCIGSEPDATVCGTGDFFAGTLDDVRIYDRALPPERIASLYSRGTGSTVSLPPPCGSLTVNDSEGNTYPTIQIGTQCWMAENMRAGTRISTGINQTDNSTVDRWCYFNNDDNCDVNNNPNNPDGGLYQWDEAMQYSTAEGAQGICPAGWHIPSDNDWKILEIALGMTQVQADDTGNRGTDQGTQLKANGSSGFEANLAGGSLNGIAFSRGSNGNYWSSTAFGGANAWSRNFSSSQSTVNRLGNPRNAGLSVRCVKG